MSSHTVSNASTTNPLRFLAQVALDPEKVLSNGIDSTFFGNWLLKTVPPSRNLPPNLHIECGHSSASCTSPTPLKRSSSSNGIHTSESPLKSNFSKSTKHLRKSARVLQKTRADIKAKRREYMTSALKIKTLDNSPVNNQQYAILRMVYDEITMYPSEAWMVLIAIVIHRSLKQVKNWFSNERQKQKTGEVVTIPSDIGERIRLRPPLLNLCQEWSDSLFEGILRVYHFKITHAP
ncbi:putative homeodomain containing protein [Lyophyllum shimeji]|uniref:Homeodomain containing protein n=1 Tax=Lyophyllum shimeji TaxID=47721 RepID=A0A9P3PHP3_LYOSH|nr:putative homeodomain containing protein [Lyophyllum shimeji]